MHCVLTWLVRRRGYELHDRIVSAVDGLEDDDLAFHGFDTMGDKPRMSCHFRTGDSEIRIGDLQCLAVHSTHRHNAVDALAEFISH
jgi:hypothetical protein